jgi:lipopolysaccharide export system protein LptC
VSADRIKKIIIAVAVVCLVVWLAMMLKTLAAAPVPLPPV